MQLIKNEFLNAFRYYYMNTFEVAEVTLVDQRKDGETNTHENRKWLVLCC